MAVLFRSLVLTWLLLNFSNNSDGSMFLYGILNNTKSSQSFTNALSTSNLNGITSNVTKSQSLFGLINTLNTVKSDLSTNNLFKDNIPYFITDVGGIYRRILKETLLYITLQTTSDNSTSHKKIQLNDALSGDDDMSAHLSVVKEMLKFVDTMNHLLKPITVIVDGTKFGQMTLATVLQNSLERNRAVAAFAIMSNDSVDGQLTKMNMIENTVLLIDSEGDIIKKVLTLSKAMGLAGKNGIYTWIFSERAKKTMSLPCIRPEGNYFTFKTSARQLTMDQLMNTIIQCQNNTEKQNSLKCIEDKQSNKTIQPFQMWTDETGAVWSPLSKEEIKTLQNYNMPMLANPFWPKLRVAIAYTHEPWIMIVDVNQTHSIDQLCGMEGRFGYRYTNEDLTSKVGICAYGVAIDILRELEKKLEFVPEILVSRDGLYGSYDEASGNASGVLREIIEDKADIAMDLMESTVRNKIVAFTTPLTVAGNGLAYIQPSKYNTSGVFGPFSTYLWLSIVFGIFGLMIFVWCLERASPYGEFKMKRRGVHGATKSFNASETMNYVWGIFLSGEIIVRKPLTIASRVSLIIFSFVSILIIASYSGNLITFLVVLDERPLINGIHDPKLLDVKSDLTGGYVRSTEAANYLHFNPDARLRNLFKRMKPFETLQEAMVALKSGKIKVFLSDDLGLIHKASIDHDCSMKVLPIKGSDRGIGIVSRKGFSWQMRLNLAVTQMTHSGAADKIFKTWFKSKQCTRSVKFYRLGINDFAMIFIMLSCGVGACLVIVLSITFLMFVLKNLNRKKLTINEEGQNEMNSIEQRDLA